MHSDLQVTFRNIIPSEPVLELVRTQARRLSSESIQVLGCHAFVEAISDRRCRVALQLCLRGGASSFVPQHIDAAEHPHPHTAVERAFENARLLLGGA